MRGQREDAGAGRPRRRAALIDFRGGWDRRDAAHFAGAASFCAPFPRVFTGGVHGPRAAGRLPAGSRAAVCTDWLAVRCLLLRRGRPASRAGGPLEERQDHRSPGLLVLTSEPWPLLDLTPGS